jgi:hypothetical protein
MLGFPQICDYNASHMMNTSKKQQILQDISAIPSMERGKLSTYSFKERSGHAGPYHKLQIWEGGKNHTHYVPAENVPAVQAALSGYAQFQQLTEEYANLVIEETRQAIAGSKKKRSHRRSSLPRKRKSNK